jgi:hypothetical protein
MSNVEQLLYTIDIRKLKIYLKGTLFYTKLKLSLIFVL